ncbi:MAG: HTTM domain-containing protein, partial [Planctomycetes bacterium]|nr:HTTM domain-containing protein [Planctomycetota bacterium]
MSEQPAPAPPIVGIAPWLPWPFAVWPWWTEPVRAERLALLRVGVTLCLLLDIAINYAPNTLLFFGKDGFGDPRVTAWRFESDQLHWSLLRGIADGPEYDRLVTLAMCLWIASAALLMLGCATPVVSAATWALSLSFANANPHLDNTGDTIRLILLFYLMLCPCGAAWSLDAWLRKRSEAGPATVEPVFVHPWAIRLIFVQMVLIYFMNGLFKLLGPQWRDGTSLHYVLGDATLTRFSQVVLPAPIELTRILTWFVLAWELSFPLLMLWKWPRRAALFVGVVFHLAIFATLELAAF